MFVCKGIYNTYECIFIPSHTNIHCSVLFFFFKLNISWRSFHIWFVALCIQPHSIPLDHDLCSIDGHFGCFQYFLQIILHLLTLYIYLLHMYRYIFKRNSQMRNYRKKKYDTWYVFMHVANSAPGTSVNLHSHQKCVRVDCTTPSPTEDTAKSFGLLYFRE